MFLQALRVAVQLALFRGNPADMPYSAPLTRSIAVLAVVTSLLLLAPVTPFALALATGLGGVAGVAFFTRQLLRGKKLDNRFLQTLAAQLLVGSLFALALWPALVALAPAMQEMMTLMSAAATSNPDTVAVPDMATALTNKPPTWAALWSDLLFIWSLAASTRINRLAADLGRPSSWLLTILSLFVLMGFVLMAQVLVALFVR